MHSNYVTFKKREFMVMKYFHFTRFFLEKSSIMWWYTTVCESSLLVQNPNNTKSFPKTRCLSVPPYGREQKRFLFEVCGLELQCNFTVGFQTEWLSTRVWPRKDFLLKKENCLYGYIVNNQSITHYSCEKN